MGALRLVFERDDKQLRLVEAVPLDVVIPPSDELKEDEDQAGFAVRIYDPGGTLIYRKALWNPLGDHAEVWTGDPNDPWRRVTVDKPRVTFDVIVPDVDDGGEVELVASPEPDPKHGHGHHHHPAKPIGRFKIHKPKKPHKGGKP